jgi:Leucine-rich repeat (LRR) protein
VKVFAKLINLKTLTLHNNKIKFIIGNFASLKALQVLDLSGNQCIDAKYPETSISDIHNSITQQCAAPVEICCEYYKDEFTNDVTCKASQLSIETDAIKILGVKSIHECAADEFQTAFEQTFTQMETIKPNDVTSLEIENQNLKFLPLNLSKVFPNLTKFVVANSGLLQITGKSLEGLENLKEIKIVGNKNLTHLTSDTFAGLDKLENVDLSDNEINSMDKNVFVTLQNLKIVNMSHNALTELEEGMFANKNKIEEIYFNDNKLKKIARKFMKPLKRKLIKAADFNENECIDMKYPENTLNDLKIEISDEC